MKKPHYDTKSVAENALRIFDERRTRDVVFNEIELFGEPAWDILLLLYAKSGGVSIGDRSFRSFVALNPLFHWLKALKARNLIDVDPQDGSKMITELGKEAMEAYFARLNR